MGQNVEEKRVSGKTVLSETYFISKCKVQPGSGRLAMPAFHLHQGPQMHMNTSTICS